MSTVTAEIAHSLDLAEQYISGWQRKDLKRIGNLLHPEIQLKSPLANINGRAAFLKMVEQVFPDLIEMNVHARFANDAHVMLAYDLVFKQPVGAVRTASLILFKGSLIQSVALFFDPRPFETSQGEAKGRAAC